MSTAKQFGRFVGVGLLQYALDFLVFATLFTMFHPLVVFNVVSRLLAAGTGYWLNGQFTFRAREDLWAKVRLFRFVILWVSLTLASTLLLGGVKKLSADLETMAPWVLTAKLVIEAVLVILSYRVQKQWVFRPSQKTNE